MNCTEYKSILFPLGGCLCFQEYKAVFEGVGNDSGEKTLEDAFFEHEVRGSNHIVLKCKLPPWNNI